MVDKYEIGSQDSSSGLLINVIRTLTTSISDDQRELERSRLEKGYAESGLVIDRLLREHLTDVKECLTSFRQFSNDITSCRERIQNVKNALSTCKSLLQCRRDDLEKLWMESAEQSYLNRILQQIYDIKHIEKTINAFVNVGDYLNAVDALKQADILLSGPLSGIDGLNQLQTNVCNNMQKLFDGIVQELLQYAVIVPFDCQVLELMKSLNERQMEELPACVALVGKYSTKLKASLPPAYVSLFDHWENRAAPLKPPATADATNAAAASARAKITECLEALRVFDHLDAVMTCLLRRTTAQCQRATNDAIAIIQALNGDTVGDSANFLQLCQVLIKQINDSTGRFRILLEELGQLQCEPTKPLADRFADILQDVLEAVISDHLEVWRSDGDCLRDGRWRSASRESSAAGGRQKTLFSFDSTSFAVTANTSLLRKQANLICPATPYNLVVVFHTLHRYATKTDEESGADRICKFSTYLHTFAMEAFLERCRVDLDARVERILDAADVWTALSHMPYAHETKVLTSCLRTLELCETVSEYITRMTVYTQRFAILWLLIIEAYAKAAAAHLKSITNVDRKATMSIHESMGWFADRMREMIDKLPRAARQIIDTRAVQMRSTAESDDGAEQLLGAAFEEQLVGLETVVTNALTLNAPRC